MDHTTETVARRWHQEIYLRGRLEAAEEICSPGLVAHGTGVAPDAPRGPRFVREDAAAMRDAFDILALTDDDVFASGDRVAIRINAVAEAALASVGFVHGVEFWTALLHRYLDPARDALGDRAEAIERGGRALAFEDAVREGLAVL